MHGFHPLSLCRAILDPLHGLIRFTDEEVKVISSPLFQRLRKIKQNGLLHYIFPSATHTRFEHSLGVLFVADSMLQNLIYNSVASGKKLTQPETGQPGQAIDFAKVCQNEETAKYIYKITRLAALVHDLGHGPLSHTFDSFAPKSIDIIKIIESDSRFSALRQLRKHILHKDRIEHEFMSCLFFYAIWAEIDQQDRRVPNSVAAAILGKDAFILVEDPKDRQWLPLINDLISSAPADADRMDYLERDSRSCGVSYGLFDRDRLLKTLLCYRNADGNYRLGLKLSGLRAIENFVQARFELFVQIYYHKTNRAIELMLGAISEIARKENRTVVDAVDFRTLAQKYIALGDDLFISKLQDPEQSAEIQEVAEQIQNRRLWKRIYDLDPCEHLSGNEGDRDTWKIEHAEKILAQLKQDNPNTPLIVDQIPPKATKDLDKGAVLLRRDREGIYAAQEGMTWRQASPIIHALEKEEKNIVRIYLLVSNPSLAKTLRDKAFEIDARFV
jgi:HD superfamily phosphohydrolase